MQKTSPTTVIWSTFHFVVVAVASDVVFDAVAAAAVVVAVGVLDVVVVIVAAAVVVVVDAAAVAVAAAAAVAVAAAAAVAAAVVIASALHRANSNICLPLNWDCLFAKSALGTVPISILHYRLLIGCNMVGTFDMNCEIT